MLCGASLVACGPEIDPGSEVQTLRVLAVQKRTPYAKPGDEVEMRMLLHDGSDEAPRDLQVLWIAGCVNPVGDLFFECFRQFAEAGLNPATTPLCDSNGDDQRFCGGFNILSVSDPALPSTFPPRFTAPIPANIIATRPPPPDPRQPRYGLAYVFFAVCAGNLGVAPDAASGEVFPIGCFDKQSGEQLASRDFVAGYSAIYAYEDVNIGNQNPAVDDFAFNGALLSTLRAAPTDPPPPELCLNCVDPPPDVALPCDSAKITCIEVCPDDGDPKCPEIPIRPVIERNHAEDDDVARVAHGSDIKEQMWINYYVDRGSVASDVRLLNDATTGWNDDHGTNFFAPKDPGPVNIWAVVHDSRGGVTWARATVIVQ